MAVEFTELEAGAAAAVLDAEVLLMEAVLAAEAILDVELTAKAGLAVVELKSELRSGFESAPSSPAGVHTEATHLQVVASDVVLEFVKVM